MQTSTVKSRSEFSEVNHDLIPDYCYKTLSANTPFHHPTTTTTVGHPPPALPCHIYPVCMSIPPDVRCRRRCCPAPV